MCKFLSVNSDGRGNIKLFKVEDVAKIMAEGNPKNYNWNSHSSISDFYGDNDDRVNKWEYDPVTKELKADTISLRDDKTLVLEQIEKYLSGKNMGYLQNLYKCNSGYRNSGDSNSGHSNSGDCNSGDRNSGYSNSGNMNSGNMNSGYRNSGDWNSGTTLGSFCSAKTYFLFNRPCTEKQYEKAQCIDMSWFVLTEWVNWTDMTAEEKDQHKQANVTGGYLKTYSYKEVWAKCPKEVLAEIKKLPNFNKKTFKEITGIEI